MAITVRLRSAWKTREGGLSATLSRKLKTLVAAAKKSRAAISLTACLRAKDFSPIPLIAFLVFALGRPYRGIIQDPQIYLGRAVADLDLSGVGRDLMFVHDGQFGFSLFRFVVRAMVALWGPAMTGEVLAIVAALAWFFAARALARQFIGGGAVWVVVIFAALLPNAYGAPYPFGFAELKAIPRPFAEACVLAGSPRSRQDATFFAFAVSSRRRFCIRSWRSPGLAFLLPSAAWKISAGFGFAPAPEFFRFWAAPSGCL